MLEAGLSILAVNLPTVWYLVTEKGRHELAKRLFTFNRNTFPLGTRQPIKRRWTVSFSFPSFLPRHKSTSTTGPLMPAPAAFPQNDLWHYEEYASLGRVGRESDSAALPMAAVDGDMESGLAGKMKPLPRLPGED